ncbi:hypothetical protein R0137_15425 [Congregibacter brevis]|uniref:Uncharacterized protein n=1 Tax=Congregibacter brevis TaxID=3081201 RepID=A0ABZ0IAU4_9GAMM|nr:hypothetical protein R0137_15425 [Congregibacter sp. IMCC45268]
MADPSGPGPVTGVSGTPPLRRLRRSGERKTRRRQQRESENGNGKDETPKDQGSRKGRFLDERC